jgi:hypothetical protein
MEARLDAGEQAMKLEAVSVKKSPILSEKWVQEQIANDPSLLGLGDLVLKDVERMQPSAGRLDLLLQDPETLKRYEVEVQLGSTDESHIIRTIEYWDIEKKRYPQYEHVAVIVAEEITSRFLNVIQLFNGTIPLIALKMTVYKVGQEYALTFVKVLDEMRFGLVDDDEPVVEPADREFWESKRGTKATLKFTDELLKIIQEVEPTAVLRYNKHYIGLGVDGAPLNFVRFLPRKGHVLMTFKLARSDEHDELLEDAGIETLNYDARWSYYRVKLGTKLDPKKRDALLRLAQSARESFGKTT